MADDLFSLTPPKSHLPYSFDHDQELAAALQESKNNFLRTFSELENISKACDMAEVTRRTVTQWQNTDDEFAARFDELKESISDRMESTVVSLADSADAPHSVRLAAAKTYLEGNRAEKYGKRGNEGGGNVQINIVIGEAPTKVIDVKAHASQD